MNRSTSTRLLYGALLLALLVLALAGWAVQGFRLALTVGSRVAA